MRKIGVLGCLGNAGRRHFNNAAKLGYDVGGFDPRFVSEAPPREEIIATSDAVIIASPSECHLQDLTDCIAARKPVLIEKPIALTGQSKQVEEQLAIAAGLPIAVGLNLRFHPEIRSIFDSINGETGEPYYGNFWCCQSTDSAGPLTNGAINDWACHEIDLAGHFFMGRDLRIVDKHVDRFQVDLIMKSWSPLTTDATIHIHSDMRHAGNVRGGVIVSRHGRWFYDLFRNPVTDAHYAEELKHFIAWIEGGDRWPLASGDDGLAVLHACERADNVRFAK
jgi:predicted dehydrogenase